MIRSAPTGGAAKTNVAEEPVAPSVELQQLIRERKLVPMETVVRLLNADIRRHQKIESGGTETENVCYNGSEALRAFKEKLKKECG